MSEFRVASRYAKSLIDLAIEKNVLDAIFNDITAFQKTLAQSPALLNLFKSPIVPGDKKSAIVKRIFGSSFNALTIAFFEIIIRKRREQYLPVVADAFMVQFRLLKGISLASVNTAIPLSENLMNEIRLFIEKQTGNKAEIQVSVNPNIIGGIVIQIGDKLYDASIIGRLKKAKNKFLNTYISK
jgi:F-type H+-transporting ATPase subunit delta